MYKIDLQSQHGDEYLKFLADDSKCPTIGSGDMFLLKHF